jgi:phytoene synthase
MLLSLSERQADAKDCATAMRGGSRSFHAAALLLPPGIRHAARSLYAFCREADDAIDHAPPLQRDAALAGLHSRLDAIYAGTPAPIAADRAFADIVARHEIPRALPQALLEGFAWDAAGRRYDTIEELEAYAARVAGTVGAMMAIIMGVRRAATLARATELGLAMQLTNIARDVGEDAQAGRLYLPLDWLAAEGVDAAAFLAAPAGSAAMQAVVARLLRHADGLYARAAGGIAALPVSCRPAIHAARLLYAAIGHKAGRASFDPVAVRAVVSGRRKAMLVARAMGCSVADTMRPAAALAWEMPAAVAALVEAAAYPELVAHRRRPIWRRVEDKAVWVLDLFAALEARERAGLNP